MPELGRWLNRDPIGEQGGINLYGFVYNNSIYLIDPFGLDYMSTFNRWIKTSPHERIGLFKQRSMFSKELVRDGLRFIRNFQDRLSYMENKGISVDCLSICELDVEYKLERLDQFHFISFLGALLQGGIPQQTLPQGMASFSKQELSIINEAKSIFSSSEIGTIRSAYETGQSATINIGGRLIQYEPGLPASGMTMFGENGFLIGREAFSSSSEFTKTILHELYRLNMSSSSLGVSAEMAASETEAAFSFAEKTCELFK